ncbi:peptidoglycan D,D-transpeptidase FtsI family protein [Haliea sp. E17]|uniref:peptidoglycan D,D-transpeptidase FtsI family protein n=1 Tax=Haliea sp. E17 TaxID=3401576 RepID=UPI003AAC9D41
MKPAGAGMWRLYVVVALLVSLLALLVGRILSLQIIDSEHGYSFLQDQGEARALRSAEIPAYRGVITDRRGEPLAVSTPVISIWADPRLLAGSEQLPRLAQALELPLAELQAKLARYEGKRFMYLVRHQSPAKAREVLGKGFSGVYGEREYQRFYPAGAAAAQLVGFTNLDGQGIAGIEMEYNDWLMGKPGRKRYIKDLQGNMVRDIGVVEPAQPGKDLRLSIDLRLQTLQFQELRKAVMASGAESGSVVTLDAATGEVLAITNYPAGNPNNRKELLPEFMRNRAITDTYEPGSTMKSLTMVAALESGHYTPETVIDTSPGYIRVGPKTYRDPRNYGEATLTRILQKSSQVGVTKIAEDLGHEPIREVFHRFGIGEPMNTGFPGESNGLLPDRKRWYATDKVSLAFGYGINTTPLQLARAYSAFASDGILRPVTLLAQEGGAEPGKRVLSPRLAHEIRGMLRAVTEDDATGRRARVPGFVVGGKTGTVHKIGPQGYLDDEYVALFAGVAPVDQPRVVSVVVINGPKGEEHGGGSAAAPVFSAVTRGALRLLGVTPTEFPEEVAAVKARPGGAA